MLRKGTTRAAFTSPPFRVGFNNLVWEIVATIPRGKVTTYGQIASMIPRPRGVRVRHYRAAKARWVGQAMAHCPGDLPWYRVINAQGTISVRSGNNHHILQRHLLEAEGVVFDRRGRVDLDRFQREPHRGTTERTPNRNISRNTASGPREHHGAGKSGQAVEAQSTRRKPSRIRWNCSKPFISFKSLHSLHT